MTGNPLRCFYRAYRFLERTSRSALLIGGLFAVICIGLLNYLTTWEMSLSVLYLFVVAGIAYHAGLAPGIIVALASVSCWTLAEGMTGMPYTRWYAPFWNSIVRLTTLMAIAFGLWFLKRQKLRIERMAHFDPLTGAMTRIFFNELAEIELRRATRYKHPFTVAYIDIDGFKGVNDRFGHQAGDQLLRLVARTIADNVRSTDCVVRMGGDEFVVLLVETDFHSAKTCLEKLQSQLLEAVKSDHVKVTFSVGAVTYESPPGSIQEMVGLADKRMYAVKKSGKNRIEHEVYRTDAASPSGWVEAGAL